MESCVAVRVCGDGPHVLTFTTCKVECRHARSMTSSPCMADFHITAAYKNRNPHSRRRDGSHAPCQGALLPKAQQEESLRRLTGRCRRSSLGEYDFTDGGDPLHGR